MEPLNFDPYIRQIAREEAAKEIEERVDDLKRPEFITLPQAKRDYALHGATLYRKIHSGELNLYGIGGKSLLKRSEVERLIVKRPPRPVRHDPGKGQPRKRNTVEQNS